jgi:type I restriction enzyme S subunit
LYKHWFVDFGPFQEGEFVDSELGLIPKGWEMKRLDEVAYKNSKTFDFKGKQEVVFVNTGDVQNGSFLHKNYSETEGLPGQAKKVIEPNDILYSEIRPKNKRYAYVDFDSSDYVVSTKFMIIRNNEKINNRLLYRILTRQDSIDEFQMIAESRSGTFPQITFDVIGHFPIVLPNLEIQNKFQSIVDPFEKQQSNNLMEIKSLTKLRDTLLPKLISGEVRLKEFREEIDAEINSA